MCRKKTKFGLFLIKLSSENGESVFMEVATRTKWKNGAK